MKGFDLLCVGLIPTFLKLDRQEMRGLVYLYVHFISDPLY